MSTPSCLALLTLLVSTPVLAANDATAGGAERKHAMKMLIVLTSHDQLGNTGRKTGFYLSELTHSLDVFQRAGIEVDLASPKGGLPPMDGVDRGDAINKTFLEDKGWMARLEKTTRLEDVDPSRYDAVYVPGGHGTMYDLPDNARLQAILAAVYTRGGVVAAVCHGPAALVNVKLEDGSYLVAGKSVSSFTDEEETAMKLTQAMPFLLESKLRERGGRFGKAPNFKPHVATAERLVTGQNPASAAGVASEVVRLMRAVPITAPRAAATVEAR
ncbi:type 1 glutamine amidotransferase domain-containing protein [Hyalangium rubrum]|uniref:Type 1 glutamine amidotransferase domain-containing protein n=1 Tax=Hyalangium rubrum TaxID=3103134 RepID=A0ABU5HG01_9BACT|nr:type 1 glutamine amidotransferase domain-containing protein [Hyalangium sp. s54d21]MDY7232171.1 type 1 glutamine amidotransferase domain-containing protein [Hyalangium sp. s54d21]